MTRKIDNLIREILLLYVKYGSEAFEEAMETLRRGAVSDVIANGMRELSRVAQELSQVAIVTEADQTFRPKRDRGAKRPSSKETAQSYITKLLKSKKENAASVGSFIQEIAQRTVLSSPSLLRNYIEMIGIPPLNARADRYSIARRIGEYLLARIMQRRLADVAQITDLA